MSTLGTRRAPNDLAPRNGHSQVLPIIPMVNGVQPESIQEWRRMLEETKREVREIKAIESHLKWNMTRDEKKERLIETKASVGDERDWKWRQSEEMKAYKASKAAEVTKTELKESKSFQEFKRETKGKTKEEEKKQTTDDYLKDRDDAQWRANLMKAVNEREKELTTGRHDDYLEVREIRNLQKEQDRFEMDENRAIEQTLEMAAIAREMAKEKEELLQALELSRAATREAPRSYNTPTAALGQLS